MRVNCILTFDKGKQEFINIDLQKCWPTKADAVQHFTSLVKGKRKHLIKVSMCANTTKLPAWYMDASGKLWSDDLGTDKFNPYL
jgi:hypothetical protein